MLEGGAAVQRTGYRNQRTKPLNVQHKLFLKDVLISPTHFFYAFTLG